MIKSVIKLSKKSLAALIALLMIISVMPFTPPISVEAADGGYEVLGNVTLDPIIYTHGAYNGTTNSEYDYMMYGSTIADGSYNGECKTTVKPNKEISSVEAVDVKDASIYVENNLLKGTLGTTYAGSEKADTTVTLKFTFKDGTYEYHKMPVKTNPVERHFLTGAFGYHLTGYRRLVAYQMLANGSYSNVKSDPSYSLSGSVNEENGAVYKTNFASMYNPFNSTYRFEEKNFTGSLSGTNKIGGTVARVFYKKTADRVANYTTTDPAIYYLDLSMSNNRGVIHTASNSSNSSGSYSFTLWLNNVQLYSSQKDTTNNPQEGEKRIESRSSEKGSTIEQLSSTLPAKLYSGSADSSNGGTVTLGGTAIAGDTIKGTYRFSYGSENWGFTTWNTSYFPFEIYVTDKTQTRTLYNNYITNLAPRCYTADSWAKFRDELLKVEEYLNDNTDTSTIDTTALVSAYNGLKPSEDANAHTYGNFTHKYTDGSAYNKDTTYNHTRSCSKCGNNDTQPCEFVNQGITGDTATVTCSVCGGTYTLSYEAYNAELKVLDGMLEETNKYSNTEACISERNSVNDSATSSDVLTQDDVDAKINELKEIENNLTLQKYSIKFNVATVDGKTLAPNITGTGTYEYGTMVELDLPEKYQTNYVVTTWKRNAKGVDKVVGGTSTKLYVVVNQESTYTAVINSVATDNVGDNAVLTLNNKSGKTIDVGFVETNKKQNVTVDINNSTITIGSVELTAPTYSFYTLKGFYIDKTPYSESGGTVTITKDTVITPYYEATKQVNIKRASGERFTINNENIDSYPANWNQRVTLKSSKEVMWLDENDVVLAQGTTYSFYANSNVTIKTKEVGSVGSVIPTASIGYFDYDSTLNKVTVVNNFFVPDGKNVTEAGVILSTKNSTVAALKKQTNGIFKGGPESFTSTGNQIRISVSRTANTKFTMYALAYVVVDGQKYFANEVKTINYKPQVA